MKMDEYKKAVDEVTRDRYTSDHRRIAKGLLVLATKTAEQYGCCAEHDIFYANGPSPDNEEAWSDEEIRQMLTWGWEWNEDSGESWSFNV